MLAYSRVKSVGVQKQGEDRRVVSSVLEDELYAMELEISVTWPDLSIERVQNRMKRFTTKRCPMAEEVFVKAEGWKLDADLDGKIKKELGREGCRHMAILMIDCCRAVAQAELARELAVAREKDPDLDTAGFVDNFLSRYPTLGEYLRLQ